jgi:hypothetical protein
MYKVEERVSILEAKEKWLWLKKKLLN